MFSICVRRPTMITPAQQRLVEHLLKTIGSDSAEAERRWANAADIAKSYARDHRVLLLARDWTADLVLTTTGEVQIVDTANGGPNQAATGEERRVALFRAIEHYHELVSILPQRSTSAVTCDVCEGAGVPEIVWTKEQFRNIICSCGGAGWTERAEPVV